MPRRLPAPRQGTPDGLTLAALLSRATRLANSAERSAWGFLGAVFGYVVASVAQHYIQVQFLSRGEAATIGFVLFVALHALWSSTATKLRHCLATAEILFVDNLVSKSEYEKMRSRCLRGWTK
jgi:hypothetical protein